MSTRSSHLTTIAQWQALVKEAEVSRCLTLNEELESYLVFLLAQFNHRPDIASRPLATEFLASFEESPGKQRECWRDVGDQCLLLVGLFPGRVEKKCIQLHYFIDLGQRAYVQVADLCRTQSATLYRALSGGFVKLMEVLQAIRGLAHPDSGLSPLQAAELWTQTQSKQALAILRQHTPYPLIIGSSIKH